MTHGESHLYIYRQRISGGSDGLVHSLNLEQFVWTEINKELRTERKDVDIIIEGHTATILTEGTISTLVVTIVAKVKFHPDTSHMIN